MATRGGSNIRRQRVRERRTRAFGSLWRRWLAAIFSWPALVCVLFITGAAAIALVGAVSLPYSVGQRIDQPIYAQVDFEVPNDRQTQENRKAARAAVRSYYTMNQAALCFDRIRADLMWLRQTAVDSETFEQFTATLTEKGWPADSEEAYTLLRSLADEKSATRYAGVVAALPLEREYVVRDLSREARGRASTAEHIVLERTGAEGVLSTEEIKRTELISQASAKVLSLSAAALADNFPYDLRDLCPLVQAVVLTTLRAQPTIVYNQERTEAMMKQAEEATPPVFTRFERGTPFITPHTADAAQTLTSEEYGLLVRHQAAFLDYLEETTPEAAALRQAQLLERGGLVAIVALLSIALMVYVGLHRPRIFEVRPATVAFVLLILGTLLAARGLDMKWPQIPELVYAPCLLAAWVLAIVYPPRFALGAMTIVALLVTLTLRADLAFLLTLLTGVAVGGYQLNDIRSRTKIITAGLVTAAAVALASAAGALSSGQPLEYAWRHALWGGGCALLAAFVVSGMLPFIERAFRVATSMTLLEWSDSRRPLLQLLAREAPGTHQHSLVLGTLAESACEAIGANGLLAQVGALYHDIGKIPKAQYFVENQEGRINWHDSLSPTMSLLIILGHVKDGLEMAKQYKLPRVLHQFIAEHHGTTVVRYFHHMASEKQPLIASGKHDREVPETEFRYRGPKPGARESAVLMLADGSEGAVRALAEPTVGRIENAVHQIVTARLNDGQFDDCDITLREIRQVEDALVKALCRHHHGRVAYPKKASPPAEKAG